MKGDNSPSVKINDFKKIPFPLPPMSERKKLRESSMNNLRGLKLPIQEFKKRSTN